MWCAGVLDVWTYLVNCMVCMCFDKWTYVLNCVMSRCFGMWITDNVIMLHCAGVLDVDLQLHLPFHPPFLGSTTHADAR